MKVQQMTDTDRRRRRDLVMPRSVERRKAPSRGQTAAANAIDEAAKC
jgi:hypothetical protein